MQIVDIKQPKQQSYYHEHFLVLDLEYSLVRLMQFPQTNCINLSISDQRLSMNVKNCIESSQLWDWLKSDQTICLFNNIFNNINVDENVDDLQYGIKELLCQQGFIAVDVHDVYKMKRQYYTVGYSVSEIVEDISNGNEWLSGWIDVDDYDDDYEEDDYEEDDYEQDDE